MTRFVTHALATAGVAVITIARPERRNALNLAVKRQMIESLAALEADQREGMRAFLDKRAPAYQGR